MQYTLLSYYTHTNTLTIFTKYFSQIPIKYIQFHLLHVRRCTIRADLDATRARLHHPRHPSFSMASLAPPALPSDGALTHTAYATPYLSQISVTHWVQQTRFADEGRPSPLGKRKGCSHIVYNHAMKGENHPRHVSVMSLSSSSTITRLSLF